MNPTATLMASGNGTKEEHARERYVFCVDDDREFLKSLDVFLPEQINVEGNGGLWYRFLFFSEPRAAIEALRQLTEEGETIAMVISDQKMPDMKGTELLGEVQRCSSKSIRVLLTGHAGIESAIQAINERLLDKYLTKPIEDDQGFAVNIRHLLQRFEMRQTIQEQAEVIGDLYQFANRLNAIEDLGETLDAVAAFTARALKCDQAFVLTRDTLGESRAASVGLPEKVEHWLGFSPIAESETAAGQQTSIVYAENLAALRPWIVDEEAAARQPLRFPLLLAPLATDGRMLGWIGASGLAAPAGAGEGTQSTLSYISDTASIAVRNMQGRERLKEAYSTIQADASRLADANRRLLLLDEMRGEFLAFISHELATPLTMVAAVDLLDRGSDDSDRAQMVMAVREGHARLNLLVKKALSYFGWLSRTPTLSNESTDVAGLVGSILAEKGPSEAAQIEFTRPGKPCPARIPSEAMETIVKTLLDNALKFSTDSAPVQLTVEAVGDEVVLIVSDRGRGFPSDWVSELFRPFTVPDTLHHHGGSGMNLAIAALIARAFQGSMVGRSDGWGKGATFFVSLPSAAAPTPAAKPSKSPETIG